MKKNITAIFQDSIKVKEETLQQNTEQLTAAIKEIPEELLAQLKTGGCLVAPVGGSHSQVMTRICKEAEGDFKETQHGLFVFVPMLRGTVNDK